MLLDISVIIVNYNVKEFLQNLLQSIRKAVTGLSHEIIIVDNNSDDGSVEFISEKFPDVILIKNSENLGFSKANNIGLKAAKGKYLLLLNPDTIVREDTLQEMIRFFQKNPDAGLAGCKILNPDGTLQLACRRSFPGPWTSFCKVTGLSSLFPNSKLFARYNLTYLNENETYEVDAISGSFMMFPRSVYEKIGGLDERFFMYGEDLDFCYRVQQSGLNVFYVHSTEIIHYKGESTKRSSLDETKIFYEAMHLFVKKHLSTSLIVEMILRSAIALRSLFAFLGRRKLALISILVDLILYSTCLFVSATLYEKYTSWRGFHQYHQLIIYSIPALVHVFISSLIGVYRKDSLSVLRNMGAVFVSFFIMSAITFFFNEFAYSRAVVIITYVLAFIVLSFWRIIFKIYFLKNISGEKLKNKKAVIIGIDQNAVEIGNKLLSRNSDIYSVAGFVGFTHKQIGQTLNDIPVIGSIENLNKVIRENKIDEVIFSTSELSYNQMMNLVASCQSENVEFKIIGDNLDFMVGKTSVSILDDVPLFSIQYNISNPTSIVVKRLFDALVSTVVLFLVYPFIYFISKLSNSESDFRRFILTVPSVFRGKYSFVGPQAGSQIGNLYLGKQGLTGLWYTENLKGQASEKIDIYYAKNQSVWLDIEILGRTLNKMWSKH
ncbi:MAG: glycosyltransferase [Ignavibacteriales bacterium]|nr:MAG: glycosyltransferase [Ignavibacteriales bacterium]